LISGYRSAATNKMLRGHSSGVAEHSLHVQGMAADIRISGRDLALVRNAAIAMKAGGVGYYPASQVVGVDGGRVRAWGSSDLRIILISNETTTLSVSIVYPLFLSE